VVVGAGAIGAFVGAALTRGGSDVVLVARGPQLDALQRVGVKVLSPDGNFEAHPPATDDLAAVADADTVFLAVKSHGLAGIAARLANHLGPHTTLVTAQNGMPWWYFQSLPGLLQDTVLQSVDPGGLLAGTMPTDNVVGCVVYCSTELVSPGVVRHVEGKRFLIGEPSGPASDRCRDIAQAFAAGGLKCTVSTDIRSQIWLKMLGNVAFNPVSALTGATLRELGSDPAMRTVVRAIMEETARVAEALGVQLPISLDQRLEGGFSVGDHKTSMLQDLEAGKSMELGSLTGAVCELAELLGVSVPHTATVHACAQILEAVRAGTLVLPSANA
jgi:2-dehydropantoate 2-reductase